MNEIGRQSMGMQCWLVGGYSAESLQKLSSDCFSSHVK